MIYVGYSSCLYNVTYTFKKARGVTTDRFISISTLIAGRIHFTSVDMAYSTCLNGDGRILIDGCCEEMNSEIVDYE